MEKFLQLNGFDTAPNKEEQAMLEQWYGGYTLLSWNKVFGNYLNLYSLGQCCTKDVFNRYFNTSHKRMYSMAEEISQK